MIKAIGGGESRFARIRAKSFQFLLQIAGVPEECMALELNVSIKGVGDKREPLTLAFVTDLFIPCSDTSAQAVPDPISRVIFTIKYTNRASRSLMVNNVREIADEIESAKLSDYLAQI